MTTPHNTHVSEIILVHFKSIAIGTGDNGTHFAPLQSMEAFPLTLVALNICLRAHKKSRQD